MKAKIDKAGRLHLQRAGTWRLQTCPFDRSPGLGSAPSYCGDWCPLFEETIGSRGRLVIHLVCAVDGQWMTDVTDERTRKEGP